MVDCRLCRNHQNVKAFIFYKDVETGISYNSGFHEIVLACLIKVRAKHRNVEISNPIRKNCKHFIHKKERTIEEMLRYAKATQL